MLERTRAILTCNEACDQISFAHGGHNSAGHGCASSRIWTQKIDKLPHARWPLPPWVATPRAKQIRCTRSTSAIRVSLLTRAIAGSVHVLAVGQIADVVDVAEQGRRQGCPRGVRIRCRDLRVVVHVAALIHG